MKDAIIPSKHDPVRSTRQCSIESDKQVQFKMGADKGIQTENPDDEHDEHTVNLYAVGDGLETENTDSNAVNLDPTEEDGLQKLVQAPAKREGKSLMQPRVDDKSPSPPELL